MRKINSIIDTFYGATSQALVFDENSWIEREIHFEQIPSTARRLAHLAIHHAARINPKLIKNCLVRDYENAGYEVLGMGRSSTVIRMNGEATKIMRSTVNLSDEKKQAEVSRLEFGQKILLSRMADYALKQTFGIIDHPLRRKGVVAGKQAIVEDFNPIEINNLDALSGLSLRQRLEIKRFTDDALDMTHETGWSPDILGASNFGFSKNSNSLVLVDTIPIQSDGAQKSTIKYLERVSQTLKPTIHFA